MPFFNKVYSIGVGEEACILDLPAGVSLKALRIRIDGIHGAVAYISCRQGCYDYAGYPLYAAIAYNGVATDPINGGSVSFTAEELKCLTREEKKLFAATSATACTIHVFGVIEY